MEELANVRLTTLVEASGKRGRPRATHQLEVMEAEQQTLMEALGVADAHQNRPAIDGVGVYA